MNTHEAAEEAAKTRTPIFLEEYGAFFVPLRITGTGKRERQTEEGERVFDRPAAVFLSDAFAARCVGCPVVVTDDGTHPDGAGFNCVVGTIKKTFADEEAAELWGVAEILDKRFFDAVGRGDLSTSPFIKSNIMETEGGEYVEQSPELVHLAIVSAGFWDTNKPAIDGLKNKGGNTMDDEKIVNALETLVKKIEELSEKIDAMKPAEVKDGIEEVKDEAGAEVKDHEPEAQAKLDEELAEMKAAIAALAEKVDGAAKTEEGGEPAAEVEIETEDDAEKDNLIDAISNIADSARGVVEVKRVRFTPNAKKTEILKKFIGANIAFVSDDNKGFAEVLTEGQYRLALRALDDIRGAVKLEREKTEQPKARFSR